MQITSGSAAGFGSNYNTRCTPMLPAFSGVRETTPGSRVGSICIGHKTGIRGPRGLGF